MRFQIALLIAVAAFAGCDRRDQNTAAGQPAPQAAAPADAGRPADVARPSQEAAAPRPDSTTKQQPPAQGQIDSREGQQKRHLDGKG